MEVVRREGEVKEPLVPWLLVNASRLFLYLCVASFVSAIPIVLGDPTFDHDVGEMLSTGVILIWVGGWGCLPGAVVWLVILSRLSPESSDRRRRTIAVILGPVLIGIVWIVFFGTLGGLRAYPLLLLFGVLWPAGAGLVVRLREHTREEVVDLGF